jgi:hypothetical protein
MNRPTALAIAAAVVMPVMPVLAQPAPDTASIWTLQDENAAVSLGTPTDRFYTNGLQLGWTSPTTIVPQPLQDLGHTLWGEGQQRVAVDLSQQIYTPSDTQRAVPSPYDRPYAGLLMGNFSLLSDADDSRSVLTLSLGLVGPWAGGQGIQNGFHTLIGQGTIKGWGAQIQNTPVIEGLHERTWRLPIAAFAGVETDALPSLTVGLGDLRDYLQTGIIVRIGQGLNSDFGVPRLRPGISGGDAYKPTQSFVWYAFAGADGQAVAYDLLLDSSPFRGGPHVSSVWDIGELEGGFALMAFGMRLTVAYVAQTQEFHGQTGGLHQLGSASISFRF